MSHGIEIWRAILTTSRSVPMLVPARAEELPGPDEGDEAVVELTRQYPGLSRALAEYLAR